VVETILSQDSYPMQNTQASFLKDQVHLIAASPLELAFFIALAAGFCLAHWPWGITAWKEKSQWESDGMYFLVTKT
jgi:hypothetical protein